MCESAKSNFFFLYVAKFFLFCFFLSNFFERPPKLKCSPCQLLPAPPTNKELLWSSYRQNTYELRNGLSEGGRLARFPSSYFIVVYSQEPKLYSLAVRCLLSNRFFFFFKSFSFWSLFFLIDIRRRAVAISIARKVTKVKTEVGFHLHKFTASFLFF